MSRSKKGSVSIGADKGFLRLSGLIEKIICLGDQGEQGIQKLHKFSQTPDKKPRKKERSQKQKKANRD